MKVLKFGATWCNGCIVMKPRWKEIEEEYAKKGESLDTQYYDYDVDKEAVNKWGIDKQLPTFVFLDKNGKEILRMHGEPSKKELIKVIEEHKSK